MVVLRIFILVIFAVFTVPVWAENISVAVAANFAVPLKKIAQMYEQKSGNQVNVSIGSSGRIYAQIVNGAPFDVFFSADQDKPTRLIEQGLAVKGSQFTYATGVLVIWAPHGNLLAPKVVDSPQQKIAIANPKIAPYGMATVQAMERYKLLDEVNGQIVYAQNVAQAYQFVDSGAASIGFVALSQVIGQPKESYVIVKQADHEPIKQDAILLKKAARNSAALGFLTFIQTEKMQDIIRTMGYK